LAAQRIKIQFREAIKTALSAIAESIKLLVEPILLILMAAQAAFMKGWQNFVKEKSGQVYLKTPVKKVIIQKMAWLVHWN